MEAIWEIAVYAKKSKSGHLQSLYYLVLWKEYPEKENIWELALTVQHFRKLISSFHKDHLEKTTATLPAIDTTSLIARPIVKAIVKPIEVSK